MSASRRSRVGARAEVRFEEQLAAFEAGIVSFVRSFGLLEPGQTPCGQPLHVSQAHALREIAARPGIMQNELARELGLARATVSELVGQLVERGWITRTPAEGDRRVRCLDLTVPGARVAADIADARRELLAGMLGDVDRTERAALIAALDRLASSARNHAAVRSEGLAR